MHLGLKTGLFLPYNPLTGNRSPVLLLKFRMVSRLGLLMFSGSKKKEPRYVHLSEAKASHLHRMWAEVSSSAPHFLHKGLLISPIKWKCLLVSCPVGRPITTLDCVLLKDKNLAFEFGMGHEISFRPKTKNYIPICVVETAVGSIIEVCHID
jgi:hypothetical protein